MSPQTHKGEPGEGGWKNSPLLCTRHTYSVIGENGEDRSCVWGRGCIRKPVYMYGHSYSQNISASVTPEHPNTEQIIPKTDCISNTPLLSKTGPQSKSCNIHHPNVQQVAHIATNCPESGVHTCITPHHMHCVPSCPTCATITQLHPTLSIPYAYYTPPLLYSNYPATIPHYIPLGVLPLTELMYRLHLRFPY